jgi:uncharacterized protein YdeI (YjbR/CyaY-like superfamily)
MITDVADYFAKGCDRCARFSTPACSTQIWGKGLADLRTICLELGLQETVKWGHPCYMHAGRNIAVFGAFQDNFRLSFMNGSLLKDTQKVLEKNGPNTENATTIKFHSDADVAKHADTIRAYLVELMSYAEAGIKPTPKHHADLVLPQELIDALDVDPDLAAAFDALTPGRKRGWNLHFTCAKKSATRRIRIAKARPNILAGKGWNER